MTPDTSTARARLDDVEAGLDAIDAALARLDAGEVEVDAHDTPDPQGQPDTDDAADAPAQPGANG